MSEATSECVFCDILAGRSPASFVHRDARCAAFMDIRPVNAGHLLVVPTRHAALLGELDADTSAHLMRVAHRLTAALRASGLRCEGVNLLLADGEAAMQEVFHVHLHVFPRFRGDGFGLRFGPGFGLRPRAALEAAAERVRAALTIPSTESP
jgi:histidine triad (HIT) family protein